MKYLKTFNELIERVKYFSDLQDTSALWFGDDISASPNPDRFKSNITKVKKERGNTARIQQRKRKEKYKENSKMYKINKVSNFSTTDDLVSTIDTDRKPSMDA